MKYLDGIKTPPATRLESFERWCDSIVVRFEKFNPNRKRIVVRHEASN